MRTKSIRAKKMRTKTNRAKNTCRLALEELESRLVLTLPRPDHVVLVMMENHNYGDIIVRARWDGTYDKTNLPDELVVTSYFAMRDGKITSLVIIFNQPSPY